MTAEGKTGLFYLTCVIFGDLASSWKVNRKLINPSFNLQVINSFLDAYIRYTTELVDILEKTAGTEQTDIIKYTWRTTLDNVIGSTF